MFCAFQAPRSRVSACKSEGMRYRAARKKLVLASKSPGEDVDNRNGIRIELTWKTCSPEATARYECISKFAYSPVGPGIVSSLSFFLEEENPVTPRKQPSLQSVALVALVF